MISLLCEEFGKSLTCVQLIKSFVPGSSTSRHSFVRNAGTLLDPSMACMSTYRTALPCLLKMKWQWTLLTPRRVSACEWRTAEPRRRTERPSPPPAGSRSSGLVSPLLITREKKKNYIRGGTTNQYLLPFTAYNIACVVVVPYTSDTNPWVIYNYVWYQQLAWEFEP